MGYDGSAEFFGVYVWEYLNRIGPMIHPDIGRPVLDYPETPQPERPPCQVVAVRITGGPDAA
jgi:hypothetical protein